MQRFQKTLRHFDGSLTLKLFVLRTETSVVLSFGPQEETKAPEQITTRDKGLDGNWPLWLNLAYFQKCY